MKDYGKKNLFKEGRPLGEYLNDDCSLKKDCISCLHRNTISECRLGGWLCKSNELHEKCNPTHDHEHDWELKYLLWKPRFEQLLDDDDFELD